MNNSTAFSTTATATTTAARPVQNSFFEPVQTSLFITPAAAIVPLQEQPRINVHCDICPDYDFATANALEARGWGLYGEFQFCPYHESQV